VDVQIRSGQLELRFVGRFTPADLELLKAIHGRRWDTHRRVWLLPHSAQVTDALRRSFGLRLTAPFARRESEPAQRPGPVEHPASGPRPHDESEPERPRDTALEAVLDAMHRTMRTREYSAKTERSYIGWARRFLRHHAGAIDHPDLLNASWCLVETSWRTSRAHGVPVMRRWCFPIERYCAYSRNSGASSS
jgi:hypothetical protein